MKLVQKCCAEMQFSLMVTVCVGVDGVSSLYIFAWHIKKVDINSSVDLLYPVNHPVHGVPLWEAVHQEGGIAPHEQQRKPLVEVADFCLLVFTPVVGKRCA